MNKDVCKTADLEEKEIAFMYFCRNWGTEECHPKVSKWKFMGRLRENEGIVLSPPKEDVDEICRNCPALKIR